MITGQRFSDLRNFGFCTGDGRFGMELNFVDGLHKRWSSLPGKGLAVRRTHLTSLANVENHRPIRWRVTVPPDHIPDSNC